MGRAQRLATLVGSYIKVEGSLIERDEANVCVGAHGRYGMWSYPDADSQKKVRSVEKLIGRTHGIMQTERFVPLSPQVADTSLPFDNQRLHAKVLESRSELES